MIQTLHTTFAPLGGTTTHCVWAYDDNGNLIDIISIEERQGHVIELKSILD